AMPAAQIRQRAKAEGGTEVSGSGVGHDVRLRKILKCSRVLAQYGIFFRLTRPQSRSENRCTRDFPKDASMSEAAKPIEDPGIAGPKHNQEQPVVWERWQKKRTFVRALEGTYSHLTKELLEAPRIIRSKDIPWKGGPNLYGKHPIAPGAAAKITQSIE